MTSTLQIFVQHYASQDCDTRALVYLVLGMLDSDLSKDRTIRMKFYELLRRLLIHNPLMIGRVLERTLTRDLKPTLRVIFNVLFHNLDSKKFGQSCERYSDYMNVDWGVDMEDKFLERVLPSVSVKLPKERPYDRRPTLYEMLSPAKIGFTKDSAGNFLSSYERNGETTLALCAGSGWYLIGENDSVTDCYALLALKLSSDFTVEQFVSSSMTEDTCRYMFGAVNHPSTHLAEFYSFTHDVLSKTLNFNLELCTRHLRFHNSKRTRSYMDDRDTSDIEIQFHVE